MIRFRYAWVSNFSVCSMLQFARLGFQMSYTASVSRLALLCAAVAAFSPCAVGRQNTSPTPASRHLRAGAVIPKVICSAQPGQSYALYIPSYYSPEKRWPIVYAFDPAARGAVPVESMKEAAERYGYIVAASNNARNGPWAPLLESAKAVFRDTQARLSIDNNRMYFAGFSGAARFASWLAESCKCSAGVFLNGASFAPDYPPAPGAKFSVFLAVGTLDFNYGEVTALDAKLRALRYQHALRRFDGPHQWAPEAVIDEAFAWFRLIAMKDGREKRDMAYVKQQAAEAEKRAEALAHSGNAYLAWEEYRQDADTFDGLLDTASSFRQRAAALEKEKTVQEGAKLEQEEIAEQSRLTNEIFSRMMDLVRNPSNRFELREDIADRISELRNRVAHQKNPRKLLVARRTLAGVFAGSLEAGQQLLRQKNVEDARICFEFAADADPVSVSGLQVRAMARALAGDRKGAIEALRSAVKITKNRAAFSAWLRKEPAFASLRDTPEFRALLVPGPR
jgi:tetratricopeptide (TPR) repeat protein